MVCLTVGFAWIINISGELHDQGDNVKKHYYSSIVTKTTKHPRGQPTLGHPTSRPGGDRPR
jgi:hypothetical protein